MAAPILPLAILAAGGLVAFAMSKSASAAEAEPGKAPQPKPASPPKTPGEGKLVQGESGTTWRVVLKKTKSDGGKVYVVYAPKGTFGPHGEMKVLKYEVGKNGLRTFVKSFDDVPKSIVKRALDDFPMMMPGAKVAPPKAKVTPAGSVASPSSPPAVLAQPAKVTQAAITAQSPGQPQIEPEPEMPVYLREAMAKALAGLGVNSHGQVTGPVDPAAIQAATATAGILQSAGFPAEAQVIRDYIRVASQNVPSPPKEKQVPLPGLPPEYQDKVNRVLSMERDPKKLRKLADALRQLPSNPQTEAAIEMLENLAAQQEALAATTTAMQEVEEVIKSPGLPPVTPEPPPEPIEVPPPKPEPTPAPVPKSPAEIAAAEMRAHLLMAQKNLGIDGAKKKYNKDIVKRFQRQAGITQDGLPGPGTMLSLAQYESDLPFVMFWPRGSNRYRVQRYRDDLRALAQKASGTRKQELLASAERERGQGGIVQAGPALT